jgi:phenylpropionate dioxygenase-like ring-hydroxylating dioxygenase large terminal subunit
MSAHGARLQDKYPQLGRGPVPVEPYLSAAHFALEKERIFKKTWIHVGRVEEIPKPGDFFVKDLAACDASIIVVRNREGQIKAMHNVCAHRMNQVVYERRGRVRKFFCKFHGWAYDLDGRLTGVPDESSFFDLQPCQHGLTTVACDVWQGFIFVNMDPGPHVGLQEYLRPVFGDVEGYPFEKLTQCFSWTTEVSCNWKLALDAFQEAYHVGYVHGRSIADAIDKDSKGGVPPLDVICGDYHRRLSLSGNQKSVYGNPKAVNAKGEAFSEAARSITRPIAAAALRAGVGAMRHSFSLESLPKGVNWTRSPHWLFDLNVVFPDFYLSLRPNYYQAYNFRPISHDRTLFEARVYYPEMTNAGGRFYLEYMKTALRDVLLEDLSTLERTQAACQTRAKSHMILQDREILVRHAYEVVERSIAGKQHPAQSP